MWAIDNISKHPATILRGALFLLAVGLGYYLKGFFFAYSDQLVILTFQHLYILALALPIAVLLGFSTGLFIHKHPSSANTILAGSAILMTIPSIALFGLIIPLLAPFGVGVGVTPAVIALVIYSLLPIIRNTYVGLNEVPTGVLRAAEGLGMSPIQLLLKVKLPLALPSILTGVRIAVVLGVGIAAIAAYIGGGGLGRWIFGGIRRTYPEMMLAGAFSVSLLALLLDYLIALFQRRFESYPQ
ncbi:MAG: ABC transporter permease [Calditrichia bacterium]